MTGHERLGWTQRAPSVLELTAYLHWVYVDGIREPLYGTYCSNPPSAGLYSCSAPLPRMTAGRHVLELTTTLTRGSQILESGRSSPLVVVVEGAATTGAPATVDVHKTASDRRYIYQSVASALNVPAAVVRLPGGSFLIGERRGTLKLVGQEHTPIQVALDASELRDVAGSDIVLHGVVLHPVFSRNSFVYVMYTENTPGDEPATRVARFRYVAGRLGERAILLDGMPARHVNPGGALGFGRDGKLYVTTDDGDMASAGADPAVLAGKVLRLNDDGSADRHNPLPSPVIFEGLHKPTALGWFDGSERTWLVDEALPASGVDPSGQCDVSVHALDDVSSACVYHGTRLPLLTGKLVIAQGDSLRYVDPARPGTEADFLLQPGLGRIQVVATDDEGFLYVGTGNTGLHEASGRDVLIRIGPRAHGAPTLAPSPLLWR